MLFIQPELVWCNHMYTAIHTFSINTSMSDQLLTAKRLFAQDELVTHWGLKIMGKLKKKIECILHLIKSC